jgi:hypothetical protein
VARRNTLAFGTGQTIEAKLVSNLDTGMDARKGSTE